MFPMNNLTQEQHLGLPRGGTWCGATNAPGVADIRPRVPVCATCHIKAMHARTAIVEAAAREYVAADRSNLGWTPDSQDAWDRLIAAVDAETTAPQPPDPNLRVEKLAQALYPTRPWADFDEGSREIYRARARELLSLFDSIEWSQSS